MLDKASGRTCRKVGGVENPCVSRESCLGASRSLLGLLGPGRWPLLRGAGWAARIAARTGAGRWELGLPGLRVPRLHGHGWERWAFGEGRLQCWRADV